MRVRRYEPGDLAAIVDLHFRWAEEADSYGDLYGPSRAAADDERAVETVILGATYRLAIDETALAERMAERSFVAVDERGCVVGFVEGAEHRVSGRELSLFRAGGARLEVVALYVEPGSRNAGVGGALLDALLADAARDGLGRSMVLTMAKDTDRVVGFYRRHGFTTWEVRLFRDDPGHGARA